MPTPTPESTQLTPAQRTNAQLVRALIDSPLAFHGLKPHAVDQLAQKLAQRVVALDALPPALRRLVEPYTRSDL